MIDRFWVWFAAHLQHNLWLKEKIISYAFNRPYNIIRRRDGSKYMARWWIMPKFLLTEDENGDSYPYKWLPWVIRLQHIADADRERHKHDHPSSYRSIILDNWYYEEDIYGIERLYKAGFTRKANALTFHRITRVAPGGTWTIFIMSRKCNDWGFLVDSTKVPWRDYYDMMFGKTKPEIEKMGEAVEAEASFSM